MPIYGYSVCEKPQPEADALLASCAEGLNFKDEDDRVIFRTRVMQAFRVSKLAAVNKLLNERKRTNYDARYQLAREYLIRRRREGAW
jgi:hypothetical protein